MSKEILLVVEAVSNEKGVMPEIIFQAIEAALASATKKRYREDIEARVSIDRNTGDYETFRRWEVVDDGSVDGVLEFPSRQISLQDARARDANIQPNDFIEEPIASIAFGRIAAQAAKQVIVQKVREAERVQVVETYRPRIGELVNGVIKRVERGHVILDLGGNIEAFIARDEIIPKESVRPGDRLRGVLHQVSLETKGPQLFVSRTAPEFLIRLFSLEVPEIGDGLIEIVGAARDPGSRAKIGVRTKEPRIDPVGACVGMRGARVQAVSNELAGERVDIILWDENPAQYVINAMSPAEVASIVVDEEANAMDVAVSEEMLSQAIGRGGQNVRLASQLTGWNLNVMTDKQAVEKVEAEVERSLAVFMEQLDVDEEIASILAQEGFSSVEDVAYLPTQEMLAIEEFDEATVGELQSRARDVLLNREIAREERLSETEPASDLLDVNGVDKELAYTLASKGIVTREDLADQSVDELVELAGIDAERAGILIMAAREIWF